MSQNGTFHVSCFKQCALIDMDTCMYTSNNPIITCSVIQHYDLYVHRFKCDRDFAHKRSLSDIDMLELAPPSQHLCESGVAPYSA